MRQAAHAGREDAPKVMLEFVAKLVRDKAKPVPEFSSDIVENGGEPIIMFMVQPGKRRPYSTHENDVFVRKGSTNRRPDPRTELRSLYPEPDAEPLMAGFEGGDGEGLDED